MLRAALLSSSPAPWGLAEALERLQALAPAAAGQLRLPWQQPACSCVTLEQQQQRWQSTTPDSQERAGQSATSSSQSVAPFQSHITQSRTGYRQSHAVSTEGAASASSSSAAAGDGGSEGSVQQQQPQPVYTEVLRVALREQEEQEAAEQQVDAYSLSRSLLGGAQQPSLQQVVAADTPGAGAARTGPARLSSSDRQVLDKLVGVLTRDGKKSRARRVLLEAMTIINRQVNAKGPQER